MRQVFGWRDMFFGEFVFIHGNSGGENCISLSLGGMNICSELAK